MFEAPTVPAPIRPDGSYAVTFVCTGNICRSPMADVIARRLFDERGLGEKVVVTSYGTGGWHVGHGADPRAVAALETHGYDGRPHRARQFDETLFATYDLIVVMDASHQEALQAFAPEETSRARMQFLRQFDPEEPADLDVPDPYYGTDQDFEDVLVMVERSVSRLVDEVARTLFSSTDR